MINDDELNISLKLQQNSHIKFWIKSCIYEYLRAIRLVGAFSSEELKRDWHALNNFSESMYPIESLSKHYEILFTRYTEEIAKSDLVAQKDMLDPFLNLRVWNGYFTELLIPEFLRYDDNIRWTLMLIGALQEKNENNISIELISSLRKFDMPASSVFLSTPLVRNI